MFSSIRRLTEVKNALTIYLLFIVEFFLRSYPGYFCIKLIKLFLIEELIKLHVGGISLQKFLFVAG